MAGVKAPVEVGVDRAHADVAAGEVGIPSEGADHGLPVDREGSQAELFLLRREVRAIALTDACEGQFAQRAVQIGDPLQPLFRCHAAVAHDEYLLDVGGRVALSGPHELSIEQRPQ